MGKITKIGAAGLHLIKDFEGLRLKPYQCSAGVWTIGIGTTVYPNGQKVNQSDPQINEIVSLLYLTHDLEYFCKQVDAYTTDAVNQSQFDALVSFGYNCGMGNLKSSTLLKKVNANPNDPSIAAEFLKWNRAANKVVAGLTRRRQAELDLYFS
jgi:lysozyme